MVLVALGVLIVPGVILLLIGVVARRRGASPVAATAVLVGICTGLLVLGGLSQRLWGGLGWILLAVAVLGGACVARGYKKWTWLQSLLTVAAVGSVVFPISLVNTYRRVTAVPPPGPRVPARQPVPIVMVSFDCFCGMSLQNEGRQIDATRFPRFAELASVSNWYRNCTTVHPRTSAALPALMTGRRPGAPVPPTSDSHPRNLFTILKDTGQYDLTSFEPFTLLCPRDPLRDRARPDPRNQWLTVLQTVLTVWLHDLKPWDIPISTPTVPRQWFGMDHVIQVDKRQRQGVMRYSWDVGRAGQFEHFLNCLIPPETAHQACWFGHFALPHTPWNFLPSGRLYAPERQYGQSWGTEGKLYEDWADDPLVTLHAHQRHILQQMYVDRLVGELIDRLRAVDLFDRCLLVVVADHGVSFHPGQSARLPTRKSLAEILSVPLFIKLPGQRQGDVLDYNVEIIDVLPTILEVIGLAPPEAVDGQSLVAEDFLERPRKRYRVSVEDHDIDAAFESRYEVLGEHLTRFGTGADPLRLFAIGPHPELLGRAIADLSLGPASQIQVRPLNFQSTVTCDPSIRVPAFLQAQVEGVTGSPVRFAISLNGTIWGTTQTYDVSYLKHHWRVMLPETAVRDGENIVRVFEIRDNAGQAQLRECQIGAYGNSPELPTE